MTRRRQPPPPSVADLEARRLDRMADLRARAARAGTFDRCPRCSSPLRFTEMAGVYLATCTGTHAARGCTYADDRPRPRPPTRKARR